MTVANFVTITRDSRGVSTFSVVVGEGKKWVHIRVYGSELIGRLADESETISRAVSSLLDEHMDAAELMATRLSMAESAGRLERIKRATARNINKGILEPSHLHTTVKTLGDLAVDTVEQIEKHLASV